MVDSHRQEIAKLEALYASNPGGRVFVHLAEALRRAGELERARSILEEGLARHPDSASGYVVLGRVLLDRGEKPPAGTAFGKALQLDGGNLVALRNLADLAWEAGRPTEALKYYRELTARNPASEGDPSVMRLMQEVQRAAAAAALAEVASGLEAAKAAAVAEPEAAVAEPAGAQGTVEAEGPDTVAPGRTEPAELAELEYGTIALEALPGDLASFAGLVAPERTIPSAEVEPEARELEDDIVVLIESSAAPLQLEELEAHLAAAPAEVNLLSALPEPDTAAPPAAAYTAAPAAADTPPPPALAGAAAATAEAPAAAPPAKAEAFARRPEPMVSDALPPETEPLLPEPEIARLAEQTAPEEPSWVASIADDDARTQDAATLATGPDAAESEYDDLPWLVAPEEAVAATGAGEEPVAPMAAAEVFASPEPGLDRVEAPDAFVLAEAAAPESSPAEDAATVEEPAIPLELTAEFEAPAEPAPAAPAERELVADELGSAELDLAATPAEGAADIEAERARFADVFGAEAAPDIEAEPARFADVFGAEAAPDIEAEPARFADIFGAEEGDVEADQPRFADVFGAEEGDVEADQPRFADVFGAEEGDVEADQPRFAEDVEAEPELAAFMEEMASARNAAGFVADAEFELVEERFETESLAGNEVDEASRVTEYLEDVEAEGELAGFVDDIRIGADYPGFVEDEPLAIETDFATTWPEAEPVAASLEGVVQAEWTEPDLDVEPLADLAPLGADIGLTEPPPASPPTDAAAITSSAELGTETLGDLYLSQGFAERAAEVYRALLRQRPNDDRLAAKVRDAEAAFAAGPSADTAEDAGEVWLRGVESAWTGGAGAAGQETTPYAWTEHEEQEREIGIGAYLRDLIGWGSEETAGAEDAPDATPVAAGSDLDRSWAASPDDQHGMEAWSQPAGSSEPDAAGGPWSVTPEPVLEATWSGSEAVEPWVESAELPVDPWLEKEPTAVRGAPSEPPGGAVVNPVEAAFNEWFDSVDTVTDAPSPTTTASAAPSWRPGDPSGEGAADEEEDDEDLEMFRAWLQSLKK